jgi:hypothetical protein
MAKAKSKMRAFNIQFAVYEDDPWYGFARIFYRNGAGWYVTKAMDVEPLATIMRDASLSPRRRTEKLFAAVRAAERKGKVVKCGPNWRLRRTKPKRPTIVADLCPPELMAQRAG